jgi:hypothetical protein
VPLLLLLLLLVSLLPDLQPLVLNFPALLLRQELMPLQLKVLTLL